MQAVRAGAGANWAEDEPVPLMRHGLLREAYFTFSYSPVRGPDGAIEGVMDIATETTRQVIDRRRLELLNALRELLADLDEEDEVAALALPLLRSAAADLPQIELVAADPARPPGMGPEEDGVLWARLDLAAPGLASPRLALELRLSEQLVPDDAYLGFLRLIASSLGQAARPHRPPATRSTP